MQVDIRQAFVKLLLRSQYKLILLNNIVKYLIILSIHILNQIIFLNRLYISTKTSRGMFIVQKNAQHTLVRDQTTY